MDDAPLRRGRPTNHSEFGEAIAILAAFALLNLAFGTIARAYEPPLAARRVALVSEAVGPTDSSAGRRPTCSPPNSRSTSRCSNGSTAEKRARCSSPRPRPVRVTRRRLRRRRSASLAAYAKNLGLAFQIIDDLLDVEGDPAETGKAIRADARKTTFVSFSGVAGARQLARELCDTADRALSPFGRRADRLRELRRSSRAKPVSDGPGWTSDDARVDELRQQLRALGYLDAGVDRFVLGPARSARRPSAIAALARCASACSLPVLLGPAAAIGIGARLPGLVTGTRDAIVIAVYLGVLVRRVATAFSFAGEHAASRSPEAVRRPRGRASCRSLPARCRRCAASPT